MGSEKNKRATKFQIFQYGFGGLGSNMLLTFISSFLIFFLTEKAGVAAGIAGTMYLIVKVIDIFIYPVFGAIADRTETRFGKYRPYLLFSTPILLLLFVLVFSAPTLNSSLKLVYYFSMYLLFDLAYSTVVVSYQSLTPIISSDSKQRNFVVMSREILGVFGSILSMALAVPIAKKFGDTPAAWTKLVIVYACIILASMYLCANGTKKHDVSVKVGESPKYKFKDQIKVITTNRPFVHLFFAFACCILPTATIGSLGMYYYKYVVHDQYLMTKIPLFMLPLTLAIMAAAPFLLTKFGKRKVFLTVLLLTFIFPLTILILRPFSNKPLLIAITVFGQSIYGIATVAAYSMLTDCIDYSEWKTGIKSAGLITATFSLATKLASGIGGSLAGIILGAVGFVAANTQPSKIINTIVLTYTLIPLACSLIAFLSIKFYPISEELNSKISVELKKKGQVEV